VRAQPIVAFDDADRSAWRRGSVASTDASSIAVSRKTSSTGRVPSSTASRVATSSKRDGVSAKSTCSFAAK